MGRIGALIVVAMTAALHAQGTDRGALVELWRSGGDTSQHITFDEVVDMKGTAEGQLLVLVGGPTPRLLFLDDTGRLVRAVTGNPDDHLQNPNGVIQLPDGRLVVNEPRIGRMSLLTETGAFLRHVTYERWGYMARWTAFLHDDGAVYEPVADNGRLAWRRWAPDFETFEMLPSSGCDFGMVATQPDSTFDFGSDRGRRMMAVPFLQPRISLARSSSGATWTGVGPDYRRIVRTPWRSCDDEEAIDVTGDLVPVPADMRLAEQEQVRAMAVDIGAPVPDLERIPRVMPPFHTLRIDQLNRLWIERHVAPDTRVFTVFTADGEPLMHVEVPAPVDPFKPVVFATDRIYYFTQDGAGWTWLVAMRLEPLDQVDLPPGPAS